MKKILFCSLVLIATAVLSQQQKPNFVLIMADDCTHWDIPEYGSKDTITPNIDKLAAEGIKMNRCYQAAPMCSPTRHNLLTGISPVKSGAYPNHTFAKKGTKSIAHYLGDLGYRVALSGKTHINPKSVFPFEYSGVDRNPEFDVVENILKESQASSQPFALFLMSNEPHTPWNKGDVSQFNPKKIKLPEWFVDTKETRKAYVKYLAEINYLDGQVGQAMDLIEKYGFKDNTLFIFLSEQGSAFPLAKWTLYEAGVKSAMIARWPGKIKPGTESNSIVEYQDIVPTFVEAAGGELSEELDGKSLLSVFKNPKKKIKDYSFSIQTTKGINAGSEYFGIRAVVGENYRYIWNLTPKAEFLNATNNGNSSKKGWYKSWVDAAETDPHAAAMIQRYKFRPGEEELYDISKDKWCMNNLAEDPKYASIKEELKTELLKWMEECGDKGQETELNADAHKVSALRKKK